MLKERIRERVLQEAVPLSRREAQRLVRVDRSVTTPTSPSERNVILSHHSAP
ncbi:MULTISPECIES: hypothetical protein [unclassified Microcoleus]|uniref:hypothetical protein n=1 Tax=unclassified Microcoleus TaxID=2642155 RepID=UPI002FCF76BD